MLTGGYKKKWADMCDGPGMPMRYCIDNGRNSLQYLNIIRKITFMRVCIRYVKRHTIISLGGYL